MAKETPFRGYAGIRRIMERMQKLAEWHEAEKKGARVEFTLPRRDFDLIKRWPKAAHLCEIIVNENGVFYRSHPLKPDRGPSRYEKPAIPIEETL